jgi:F-type H+-transporting ATPase subunit b
VEHVTELLHESEFWVGLALLVFLGLLLFLGVHKLAARGLDAQAAKIRGELAEAERLRKEAEDLLANIRTQRADAERAAAEMLANAEVEARRIEADASAKLEEQVKRRGELAQRKIAQAEARAAADVKAAAADLAADMAANVFAARVASQTSDPLVDRAVGEIAVKLS